VPVALLGDRGVPWTEADYLALGDTKDRVELIDGSLIVTPAPTPRHQHVSRLVANALEPAASDAGLEVYEAVNVRLREGRIPIPDLVIVEPIDPDEVVIDVSQVRLVCEIVSASNPAGDRVLKMHLYADAGIPWYLLIEPVPLIDAQSESVTMSLFQLDGDHYTEHATGSPGAPLEIEEPITTVLDPARLLRSGTPKRNQR
jgi:Uma2 family endonuclease